MRLKDKVAIITGSANGIGKAALDLFLQEGAKVVIADFDEATGKQLEQDYVKDGFDCLFIQLNVANSDSVKSMVEQVIEKYGKIDILINNSGITRDALLVKMDEEQFNQVLDVNLKGV